ncbi:MAG: hypothetical protein IPK13_17265 [Deltaproteobacteria bacterium]|nr:hypothetical protein [Deltaproteobacteria bacterium]
MTCTSLNLSRFVPLTLTAGLLWACPSDPEYRDIDSKTALLTANQNMHAAMTGLGQAGDSAQLRTRLQDLAEASCDADHNCLITLSNDDSNDADDDLSGGSFESDADEFEDVLRTRIFNERNVEQELGDRVILRMKSEIVCREDEAGLEIDEDCATFLDKVPVRIQLTSLREGDIDAALLIGESQLEVLVVSLYESEIAVEADLDNIKATITQVAGDFGEEDPLKDVVLSGALRAWLQKTGDLAHTVGFGITRDLKIAFPVDEHEISINAEKSDEAITLHIDGEAKTLQHTVSFGDIRVSFPIIEDGQVTCNNATGCVESDDTFLGQGVVHLAGITSVTEAEENVEALRLRNISLGNAPATLTVNDLPVLSVALNPSAGGVLDALLKVTNGNIEVTVTPSFEALVDLAFKNLPNANDVPAWASDEKLSITLDGSNAPKILFRNDMVSRIEVLAGHLTFAARQAGTTVTASAGECVAEVDTDSSAENDDSHPFENLAVTACE